MAPTEPDIRSAAGLLALQSVRGVGPKRALRIALFDADPEATLGSGSGEWPALLRRSRQALEHSRDHGVDAISIFDVAYPERLRAIPDPPPVLFVLGSARTLGTKRAVAIVGTREPSDFGCSATEEIVATLAAQHWLVISGLALGIDSIAHGGALKHGTATAAVMAGGLDRVYPKQNQELARAIVDRDGALASEHRWGEPPSRAAFVQRNRIQSGLAAALIVTQTGISGGTMHTVRHAAAQGRPIYCAVPHSTHPRSEGLAVLLRTPANKLCQVLPAWRGAERLCSRLGEEPLAKPITRESLDELLETLNQIVSEDPQRRAEPEEQQWSDWSGAPGGSAVIDADDALATLFALSD